MIDLVVERALRLLAKDAGVSRGELIEAIVCDWLLENKVLSPEWAAPKAGRAFQWPFVGADPQRTRGQRARPAGARSRSSSIAQPLSGQPPKRSPQDPQSR